MICMIFIRLKYPGGLPAKPKISLKDNKTFHHYYFPKIWAQSIQFLCKIISILVVFTLLFFMYRLTPRWWTNIVNRTSTDSDHAVWTVNHFSNPLLFHLFWIFKGSYTSRISLVFFINFSYIYFRTANLFSCQYAKVFHFFFNLKFYNFQYPL